MNGTGEFVRSTSAHLDASELLKQPFTELLSVSPDAATALAPLGIKTIFDLGCSRLFAAARVAAFAKDEMGAAAQYGMAPGDLLDDAIAIESVEAMGTLPLAALRMLDPAQAAAISQALNVTTLRDFAQWPPYLFAKRLVSGSIGGSMDDRDAILTEKLRPTFGEFPTERVYYTTLVMLQMNETTGQGTRPLDGGVSLDAVLADRNGFTKPAIGALMTYSQSWYAQGITFGHLLHSLALAPGEATRIAIVDWARRTSATSSETISETEELASAALHTRALSEVQDAVASEMQEGGSTSSSHADSTSYSAQASVGTGFLTSLWASGDASGSLQGATTDTTASSSSWSVGNRSVAASMQQNINDRTEQHSTSVRNRRATAVREVSQSEHEQVSTRIVANYNHMHALTIQYYEIVQVYRVATRLHRAERCLFIPMERLDFAGPLGAQYVERFRGALGRAALNRRALELLLDDTSAVEISATSSRIVVPSGRPDLVKMSAVLRASMIAKSEPTAAATVAPATATEVPPETVGIRVRAWDRAELASASRFVARPIVRPGSDSLFVPDETELLAISFEGVTVTNLRLDRVDSAAADVDLTVVNGRVDLPAGVRMGELDGIYASRSEGSQGSGQMTLLCAYLGRRFTLPSVPVELGTAVTQVAKFRTDQADRRRELLAHLQANNAHYAQAIARSLDSATLVLLLSEFTWNGRPVIDQVEPKVLTVAGNFLVLRAPVDPDEPSGVTEDGRQATWSDLLKNRGFDFGVEPDSRVIPIPTNGVFAEAVLGRSNSAEKLEYTRFWNWQDSPIPLTLPEIAPVSTGSRATSEDLRPGQLGQPVLNIVTPTSLPDPAGLGAVLTAVSNGNMFRDMSGLAGTQNLAGQVAQGTIDAATAAAEVASSNMRAEMQKSVAMGQIAADIVKAALGAPSSGGANQSVTAEAARVAHGEKRDAAAASAAAGADGSVPIGGGGGGSGGGESGAGTSAPIAGAIGGDGAAAFNKALYGPLGMPAGDLVKTALKGGAADGGGGGGGGGGAAMGGGAAPVPVPAWADAIDPFPPPGVVNLVRNDPSMTTAFAPVTVSTANHLCAGLADVTGAPASAAFAGLHEEEMVFVGSLMKLCVMYAAFALRERVQAFVDAAKANGEPFAAPAIFGVIENAWRPKLKAMFPTKSTTSFGNNQDVTVPKFDRIFTVSPTGVVDFSITSPMVSDASIDAVGENGAPTGLFHEWMRTMMRWSNNQAASNCILALGYFYLNGVLARSGYFDAATSKGLWISGDYDGHDWVRNAAEKASNAAGIALTPRWATAQGRSKSNFVGNALQVSRLLTAMANGKLLSSSSSTEMRALMNQMGGGIGSYARTALTAVGRAPDTLASKIGFGDDSFSHDCAIIERTVGGKLLRYVAVVFGSAPAQARQDLSDLFVLLDSAVVARHP
ncbi:serine hydrolase [Vulgatibacter incomptus]|uniref:serine hydrolase n=1 Tax=Vulgatibacter incomptus TaxID=1391653 RepID=UPI000B19860F|nr:serine hydrolase [Vulgatibacter incomptus]